MLSKQLHVHQLTKNVSKSDWKFGNSKRLPTTAKISGGRFFATPGRLLSQKSTYVKT